MNSSFFKAIIVAIIGLGLLSPQISEAEKGGSTPVKMRYAGSGIDTHFDTNGDGLYLSLSQANGRGTFGNFAIAITAEFGLPSSGDCAAGELDLPLVSSEAVYTFADQSQLFAIQSGGYLCLDTVTGHYYGQVEGDYVGGTGRFEGATGRVTSQFEGQNLGNSDVGFRSIKGTVGGTVNRSK